MRSSDQRDDESPIARRQQPHFFKIILQQSIREGKLEIPRKFGRKYGNGMSSPILLRLPDGAEWEVELAKSEGRLWLQNGSWQQFVEHYSLKHGNFLVFRYDCDGHFSVLIFDLSASEIDYPHGSNSAKNGPKFKQPFHNLITKQAEDDFSQPIKIGENSELPCPQVRKLMESNAGHELPRTEVQKTMKPLTGHKKDKALQKASGFKSKKPFFKVVMQPSYVLPCYGSGMAIPVKFARRYVTGRGHRNVNIQGSKGKTWPVSYYCLRNSPASPSLRGGWMNFVRDNHLKVGDVCVFELINGSKISFKVAIYRG